MFQSVLTVAEWADTWIEGNTDESPRSQREAIDAYSLMRGREKDLAPTASGDVATGACRHHNFGVSLALVKFV